VGVQLITYIQHWGLGSDSLGQGVSFGRGWDEDCRFQAWATLNISLHDEHHRHPRLPYYRVSLSAEAPRLPAGYVVLMFVSLVPPLWFKLLTPFLEQWRTQPDAAVSAGHRITCFGMDRPSGQAGEQMR
jgi:alkane 1-monooxygenase